MADLTAYISAIVMLIGILVGTLISPRIQHRVGIQYSRRDLIFQKKMTYFESVIETIEKNKRLYYNLISKIEDSKKDFKVDEILEELKKNRKRFNIMASPLYFNTKIISEKIMLFVRIEKDIFNKINLLKDSKKEKRGKIIESLKNNLKKLNKEGMEILYEMKKELVR
jgi:hypothetical protein